MKVEIISRNQKTLVNGGLTVSDQATVEDLKAAFELKSRSHYPSRQRFTTQPTNDAPKGVPLTDGKRLADFGISNGSTLVFKDLGPQVGYSTVFFWEYFGPLVLYAAVYFLPQFAYPHISYAPPKNLTQQLALLFWTFHYAKRILETFFVHRFSHGTMPIFNLYRNCGYYWAFGAYISWCINHPLYTAPPLPSSVIWFTFAMTAELANAKCHMIQAGLRSGGSKEYVIPHGFLFDFITCANYTAEIGAWLSFSFATQTLAALLFAVGGTCQMVPWALQKHNRLRKTFDGKDGRKKYPKRWIILPPFL